MPRVSNVLPPIFQKVITPTIHPKRASSLSGEAQWMLEILLQIVLSSVKDATVSWISSLSRVLYLSCAHRALLFMLKLSFVALPAQVSIINNIHGISFNVRQKNHLVRNKSKYCDNWAYFIKYLTYFCSKPHLAAEHNWELIQKSQICDLGQWCYQC